MNRSINVRRVGGGRGAVRSGEICVRRTNELACHSGFIELEGNNPAFHDLGNAGGQRSKLRDELALIVGRRRGARKNHEGPTPGTTPFWEFGPRKRERSCKGVVRRALLRRWLSTAEPGAPRRRP